MQLIQGGLNASTVTYLMHFKWELTWTHGTQPNTFYMGQSGQLHFIWDSRVNRHSDTKNELSIHPTVYQKYFQAFLRALKSPPHIIAFLSFAER